jgi:hypothetical protein
MLSDLPTRHFAHFTYSTACLPEDVAVTEDVPLIRRMHVQAVAALANPSTYMARLPQPTSVISNGSLSAEQSNMQVKLHVSMQMLCAGGRGREATGGGKLGSVGRLGSSEGH